MNNTSSDEHRYTLISVEKAPESASEMVSENAPEKAFIPEESLISSGSAEKAESSSESALDNLTEDDLKSFAPLENVHKILIVVLILGLVAFGLYFVLFR